MGDLAGASTGDVEHRGQQGANLLRFSGRAAVLNPQEDLGNLGGREGRGRQVAIVGKDLAGKQALIVAPGPLNLLGILGEVTVSELANRGRVSSAGVFVSVGAGERGDITGKPLRPEFFPDGAGLGQGSRRVRANLVCSTCLRMSGCEKR